MTAEMDDRVFLELLRRRQPAQLRLQGHSSNNATRFAAAALRGTSGGTAYARRLVLRLYSVHGLDGSEHLITVLSRDIQTTHSGSTLLPPLLNEHRHTLPPHLVHAGRWLASRGLAINYATLYTDLKYHTPRVAKTWFRLAQEAAL